MIKRIGVVLLMLAACKENEPSVNDFTGNEAVYALNAGSAYNVSGTVTIKEKTNGSSLISVQLNGTEAGLEHPVHLHIGAVGTPDAAVAALLTPVAGASGKSETTLTMLADESAITYAALLNLDACIKIHLAAAGEDRNIILAAGNIGSAVLENSNSRVSIAVCK